MKKVELGTDESVAFTGLKREFLLIHGVGIKMREGISGGAEG
jgi:hypothetical protein